MANKLQFEVSVNGANASAQVDAINRKLKQMQNAYDGAGKHGVTSVQAISASLRLAEGNFNNLLRAGERFIALSPQLSNLAKQIFPFVGGIAVASIFVRMGKEAYDFIQTARQIPNAIQSGFTAIDTNAQSTIANLNLQNAKLEEQIAILSGKAPDTLATQLAADTAAAWDLVKAISKANEEVSKLLQQNSTHWYTPGQQSTQGQIGSIKSFQDDLDELSRKRARAVAINDQGSVTSLDKQIADKYAAAHTWANNDLGEAQGIQATRIFHTPGQLPYWLNPFAAPNQSARIKTDQGFLQNISDQLADNAAAARNKQDEATADRLRRQQEAQRKAQEAARQAAEATRKQQEAIIKAWQSQLDNLKAVEDVDTEREISFWAQRVATAKAGSQSYLAALDNANKAIAKVREENVHSNAEFGKTASGPVGMERFDLGKTDQGYLQNQGRAAADFIKNLNEGVALQRQNAAAFAEASLQMAVATGQMSRLDAAQVIARLHAQEYEQTLGQLQDALKSVASDPTLSPIERQQRTSGLNNQIAVLNGQRQIQVMQDQQTINGQTIGGAAHQALDEMVTEWRDMATQIRQVLTQSITSLNDQIAKAATGQKTNFGGTFQGIGQGLVKTGLQGLEGSILHHFGFGGGKPDGTKQNPLYVLMAGAAGSVTGVLGSLAGDTSDDSGDSGNSGGGIKGFFASLLSGFQGGRAGGGDVVANRPVLVGENGPEIMWPNTAGTVIPNHAIGGVSHTYHIDARGSSDPAGVEAAVRRALPQAVSGSMQAQHQRSIRTPQHK